MTEHVELRRLAALAHPDAEWFIARNLDHPNIDKPAASFIAAATPKTVLALLDEIDGLKAENEALRKDAERWRYARTILPYEVIQDAQKDLESWNVGVSEAENKRCDEAIDAALEGATQ
ncbi:ead/Ea22-like family protein [Pseudomonas aeruginosa]